MNDIARSNSPSTGDPPSDAPATLAVKFSTRRLADPPVSIDDRVVRLTWRRLDRVATAATLGMVLVAPQTALLMARMLGPRIPPTAAASSSATTSTRRQEMGR
jgi:hypothetical protein